MFENRIDNIDSVTESLPIPLDELLDGFKEPDRNYPGLKFNEEVYLSTLQCIPRGHRLPRVNVGNALL